MTPNPPRIVSLCSGYGGLDLAVEAVFGAVTEAHCEWEAAPSKVLAHRWPGVRNLHDVKTADWSQVDAEILTAGYPCQPFSHAGQRKGTDDERHLWPHIAEAIRRVRPRLVVLENVAGHRSLGFGDVLADMAAMRYVGSWVSLRAADIGACHGRERVFILARDAAGERWDHAPASAWRGESAGAARGSDFDAADTDCAGSQGPQSAARRFLSDGRATADAQGARCAGVDDGAGRSAARSGRVAGGSVGRSSAAHPNGVAVRLESVLRSGRGSAAESGFAIRWGKYEPAIRRHERILGRLAPAPSELAPKGGQRLAPRFVEWMQMLPEGWVTEVPDLTRDEQLTALGNGVIPRQAAEALRRLLPHLAACAA